MSDFEEAGCGLVLISSNLHPRVKAIKDAELKEKGNYWGPKKSAAENNAYLSARKETVNLIVGTDTTTGNTIALSSAGKLKVYYKFGWPVAVGDTGYSLTQVQAEQIFYGGTMFHEVVQSSGLLDFTSYGGVTEGILTIQFSIILE